MRYLCLTINSYSGEELDDVKDAGCHLFENGNHNEVGRQVRQAGRQWIDSIFVFGMSQHVCCWK